MAVPAQFPNTFIEPPIVVDPLDLPGKHSMPLARLKSAGYDVLFGINRAAVPALGEIAHQAATLEFCPNDIERWGDVEKTKRQLAESGGRAVMQLVSREDGLMVGFGWTDAISEDERVHLPNCATAVAVRLHEDAQGKGLAANFTRSILATTMAYCHARRIGLQTWGSNPRAVKTFLKAGAVLKDVKPDIRPTTLFTPRKKHSDGKYYTRDVRLFMEFPETM